MNFLALTLFALSAPAADPAPARADSHQANPVYQELLTRGVGLGAGRPRVFPPALMADGLTAAQQQQKLRALCVGPDPRKPLLAYDDVIDRDAAAAYYFDNRAINPSDPKAPAYSVDIWFVTYGDLAKIAKRDPLQLFGTSPSDAVTTELDKEALEERKITPLRLRPPLRERYVNTVADLLNTVKLSLTNHAVVSQSGDSLVVASKVDPRFNGDKEYPNMWQMLPEGLEANPKAPKGPQPIDVGAFYLKITRLAQPQGALFVEFHQVSTEPKAWFNGGPVLRGKIPLEVNKRVKDFRIMAMKTAPRP
jgi:hypothetical protein